jgi:hypothetical protein
MKNKIETIKTKLDQDKVLYVEDLCKFFRVNKRAFFRKLDMLREEHPNKEFLFRSFTNWFLFESDFDEFVSLLTIKKIKVSKYFAREEVKEIAEQDEFLKYLLDPRASLK